ncbi:MAG: hypothetical protein ACTSVB_05620 [Candidatus Heimdallarchaeaceae archaeon]
MNRTELRDLIYEELVNSLKITDEALLSQENIEKAIDLALEIYSNYCPRAIEETFTNLVNTYEITVSNPMYSDKVIIYYISDNKRYFLYEFSVDLIQNTIIFDNIVNLDSIIVKYYTKHVFTDSESTIPVQHTYALFYLSCHILSRQAIFGEDSLVYFNNGILQLRFDTSKKKGVENTYLENFFELVRAKTIKGGILWGRVENSASKMEDIFDFPNDELSW